MTEMHSHFGTWYSQVDFGDSQERLTARWAGVSSLLKKAEYSEYEQLVDVFLQRPGVTVGAAGELIRGAMRKADSTFPPNGNDAELKLLAEIVIALKIETKESDALAGQVASLAYTAIGGGEADVTSVTKLLPRSQQAMRFQGAAIRRRTPLPKELKNYAGKLDFADCIEDGENMSNIAVAKQVMERMSVKITTAMHSMGAKARKERDILNKALAIQDEELNLLWWSSNGMSQTTGELFSKVKLGQRAIIAAVEAADLTKYEPGPSAIGGLLEKVGVSSTKSLKIYDAVNTCDEDWLRETLPDDVGPNTPVHFAISKRLETPDISSWSASWASITKIDAEQKLTELAIAHLFYRERLVLNAFGEF